MIVKFLFNNVPITFESGNGIIVNATEMAKPFGKRFYDWVNLPSTQEFLDELTITRENCNSDFQAITTRTSAPEIGGGTWLNEDAALEFARWLSPKFAIWCNDRIKELLTKGTVSLPQFSIPKTYAEALRLAADQAKQIEEQERELAAAKPKILFSDTVETSTNAILVGQLAKLMAQKGLTIGQNRLFDWLRKNGYICTQGSNRNYPTQRSIDSGLLEVHERTVTKPDGSVLSVFTTKVTGKGQVFFVNKYLECQRTT